MKKTKNIRLTAFVIACVTIFMLSVSSYAESSWQEVFTNDFSAATSVQIPELTGRFTAEIKNEALEMKSDDVCEWVANDLSSPNADANTAGGIKMNGMGGQLDKHDDGYAYKGSTWYYTGGSDVAWYMDSIGGKNAAMLMKYPKISLNANGTVAKDEDKVTLNRYQLEIVDYSKFLDNVAGTYEYEVDYYVPAEITGAVIFSVMGNTHTVTEKGSWQTWKTTKEVTSFAPAWNKNITLSTSSANNARVYINRISIKKAKTETPVYSDNEKTAVLDLGLDDTFGNTAVSFDMTLPKNTKLSDTVYYNNATKNSGRFGIADENGTLLGAVQIDTKADSSQTLYAVTGGDDEPVELYTGDILGKTLNYRFETDWTEETYTVAITYNGVSISSETEVFGPFAMTNASDGGNASVRKLRLVHNSTNAAMLTQIDNVTSEFIENPDYAMCKVDADALTLDIPEDGIVTESFALPTTGTQSGASITWSSSDAAAAVEDSGDYCTIVRGAERKDVTLTATLEIQGVQVVKTFDITVEKNENQLAAEADIDAIVLSIPSNGVVTNGFALPIEGSLNESFISWVSNSPSIVVDNSLGVCTLVRGEDRATVVLTATAYKDVYSATKTFTVTVEKHADKLKAEADAAAISLDIPDNMRIRENFTLPSAGSVNAGAITWVSDAAALLNVENGIAVITRGQTDEVVTLTATVRIGDYSCDRVYRLTLASLIGTYANVSEIEETITGGVLTASVSVQSPGNSGTLYFAAFSADKTTGQITDRRIDSESLNADTRYATIPLSISGLSVGANDEVQYFIWNENRESLRNNAPGDVTGITAEGKGKGVRLNWTAALDDNDAVDGYSVYRDGEYVGSASGSETTYLDTGAEVGVTYDYTIIAEDTNGFKGGSEVSECTPALGMYYINYDKKQRGEEDYIKGFTDYSFKTTDTSADAYAYITEVTDANGETCYAASTTKKYIMCTVDSTIITGLDNELVIEIDYLDTTAAYAIDLYYNKKLPDGEEDTTSNMFTYARAKLAGVATKTNSRTWKTAVIKLTDAQLRKKGSTSCDFAFYGGNGDENMYIREVRIIQTPLYD